MQMKIRGVVLAAVLVGVMFLGISCSNNAGSGSDSLKVGFSQIGAESAWRSAETDSIRNKQ